MKPMEMEKNSYIPEDAKKYMFAEDLISFFLNLHGLPADFQKAITWQYRPLIPKAFNEIIQLSTCFLYCRISVFNTFKSFDANNMINTGTFLLFAQHLETKYFCSSPINPQKFLYFCTHLAYMAKSFYASGAKEIPKIAASYIMKTMKVYEMPEADFWNGLNIAAFKYLKMALECGFLKEAALDSVKIQFVVHESIKEEHLNNRIIKGSSIDGKYQSYLLKIAAKIKKKKSAIDDNSSYNGIKLNATEIEKMSEFYEENFNNEVSSDSSSTETDEENFDLREKKSFHEDESEVKYINPLDAVIKTKMQKKISPTQERLVLKIINGFINKAEITSPIKNRVNCPMMTKNEFKVTNPATRPEMTISPKEQLNYPIILQKGNKFEMTHSESGTEITTSPKEQKHVRCSLMKQKDCELRMTNSVIDRDSVNASIENSAKSDKQVNNLIQLNKSISNPDEKVSDEIGKSVSNVKWCAENKLDPVNVSSKCKVTFSDKSFANESQFEMSIDRNKVKRAVDNEITFLSDTDNICSFNKRVVTAAENSEIKDKENRVEQFDKSKTDILVVRNKIKKENSLEICKNSTMKHENFMMNDSYTVCKTEADANYAQTSNSKADLPNLEVGKNEKENELTCDRFFNKNKSIRKVDDQKFFETTYKTTKENDIDSQEQVLNNLYNSSASNQTDCLIKSFHELTTLNADISACVGDLKTESDVDSLTHEEIEIAETLLTLSKPDFHLINYKLENYFNDCKPKTPASTTVTYSPRISPLVSEKIADTSSSELNTKLPNSVLKDGLLFGATEKESTKDEKDITEKLKNGKEIENSPMITLDFDVRDEFVIGILRSANELELYGETHEHFISKEDYFNSTFDILTVVHHMAAYYGIPFLDIQSLD